MSLLDVNGKAFAIREECESSPEKIDPLTWLSHQLQYPKFYWKGRDQAKEIACCGSILELPSPPSFGVKNTSTAPFWGGQAFSHQDPPKEATWSTFPRRAFILPQTILHVQKDTSSITNYAIEGREKIATNLCKPSSPDHTLDVLRCVHSPPYEEWMRQLPQAIRHLESGALEKVVLARRTTFTLENRIDPFALLKRLQPQRATLFAIAFSPEQVFIGATPEMLYQREENLITTEALAGTRKRGQTDSEDKALGDELMHDPKELAEFGFVKDSIHRALTPICSELAFEKEDQILKTTGVQHLYNPLKGTLQKATTDEAIIDALHPTAAMGGSPKKEALAYLQSHEQIERGWYSAPFGIISAKEAQMAVGIRSALVDLLNLHLFTGVGIVAQSDPTSEWEELEHKISQWTSLWRQHAEN